MSTNRGTGSPGKPATRTSAAIPRPASLAVDPDRLAAMWAMAPAQRRQAAERGQLSLGEMLRWAARSPHEVPLVDGEYFFITALAADRPEPDSSDGADQRRAP